ncbi:heterokaryon incompatibility protein-domain-containing protein [Rhodocollybia butyracea]|uniref:Heterokaryon incompatibility protein-domain-containing protein n=1 Tax=Rhodocollybia butyracea TaxID=206335 RepID=A0A9P5PF63_9AGAR|nr:heterokaryon incompatibility protein-domain-containing protein [Rhodocollybia butyracea]
MRFIQTTSTDPELVYFADEQRIPEYAILSHVWEEEEVTFQDMQDSLKREKMKGWSKIVRACELACNEDWDYIWVDTCCIDKSSSAELSEAINSMYRYYRKAQVCYVYLADMQSDLSSQSFNDDFGKCKWFKRGWTLQELIAPTTVFFFAQDWAKIGTKASLQVTIAEITRIPSAVLLWEDPSKSTIAARMSWAAGRETTRIEDRAYSLMGIFGVYMPPIYGEGEHAFIRLQEEILKASDDHTIFAWKSKSAGSSGLLGTSPEVFEGCSEYETFQSNSQQPFSLTNMGLLVYLPLLAIDGPVAFNGRFPEGVYHEEGAYRIPDRFTPFLSWLFTPFLRGYYNFMLDSFFPTMPRIVPIGEQFLALLNCRSKTSEHLAIYIVKDGHQCKRVRSDLVADDTTILAKRRKIKIMHQKLLFKAWDLPRFEHNYVQPDQIVAFFSGQGIRPVADGGHPVAAEITDTGDYSMGVFKLSGSEPCTFLFMHDPTHRPFVVVAGTESAHFWLDLVFDFETDPPNLENIRQSYTYGKEREDIPQKKLDRISKFLTDNVAILVEARRRNQSKFDTPCLIVNIHVDNVISSSACS